MATFQGQAGIRKIKPMWFYEARNDGISWTIRITTQAHHHSIFNRPDALPDTQPTVSKHWRQTQRLTYHKCNHQILLQV